MPETVKSSPHQKPKIKKTRTTNGTGTAAIIAAMTRIPRLMRRAAVELTFMEDESNVRLTRKSWATAGGSELCQTLNYHLSTLNFLSTTASGWLQRLVRAICGTQDNLA